MIPFLFTTTSTLNELDWDMAFFKEFMDQTDTQDEESE